MMNVNIEKAGEIDNYWKELMPMMAIEELAELQQAISKIERNNNKQTKQDLITEMADVIISMAALEYRYDIQHGFVMSSYYNYGINLIAMKNISECQIAISNIERQCNEQTKHDLIAAMASVMFTISALQDKYNIFMESVEEAVDKKLNKKYDN